MEKRESLECVFAELFGNAAPPRVQVASRHPEYLKIVKECLSQFYRGEVHLHERMSRPIMALWDKDDVVVFSELPIYHQIEIARTGARMIVVHHNPNGYWWLFEHKISIPAREYAVKEE